MVDLRGSQMITPPLLIMSLQGKANVLYELGSYNHPSGSIQRLPQRFEYFFHAPIIQNDPSPRCSQHGLLCWQPPAMDVATTSISRASTYRQLATNTHNIKHNKNKNKRREYLQSTIFDTKKLSLCSRKPQNIPPESS